jgi:tetratricopeptide (TPR) repeat protein
MVGLVVENKKEYALRPNSLAMLFLVFIFTIIFILLMGILIIEVQRYFAEINYHNSLIRWQKGDFDGAISQMEDATSYNANSDLYFSQLSQAYILKIKKDLTDTEMSTEEKTKDVQALATSAINASEIATDINPQNANNWAVKGFVYQNLIGVSSEMQALAEDSYKQAINLDPFNPYLVSQLGILYYQKKDFASALTELKKAKDLNPNYPTALYYLGLVYDAQGNKSNALSEFKIILELNPEDTGIKKIVANLNAGAGALSGILETAPAETPQTQLPEVSGEVDDE